MLLVTVFERLYRRCASHSGRRSRSNHKPRPSLARPIKLESLEDRILLASDSSTGATSLDDYFDQLASTAAPSCEMSLGLSQQIASSEVLTNLAGSPLDMFLMVDGIEGESTDAMHHGEIEIDSFSWGESNDGSGVRMQDFAFTALMSKASVELFAAVADGRTLPQAVLSLRRSGETSNDFFTYTLSNVHISSYQTAAQGNVPEDAFSVSFSAIELAYRPLREDGTLDAPLTAAWQLDGTTFLAAPAIESASSGSIDAFLMIDGIEGESTDSVHHREIDIGAFSWGEFNDGTGVRMQDFTFTASMSKASVELFASVADGRAIPQAVLSLRKSGTTSDDFFTCTLSGVYISSYQTAAEGNVPDEVFSLGFSAIEVSCLPQREDGTLGMPLTAGWELDGTTLSAVTAIVPASAGGSVDAFLMIDGIEGESTDVAHHSEIDIGSFSWGEFNDGSGVQLQDFAFTALMSKASVELFAAAADGRMIPEAVLSLRKSGVTSDDFLTCTLSDVHISSYQTAAEGNAPQDAFSVGFSAIELAYRPQRADGALDAPVTAAWELDGTTLLGAPASTPASAGSIDAFLMIDGIEGDSTNVAHHGEIEIESFSWGEFNDGSGVQMQDFAFTALMSKASVELFEAVADGHTIPQAVLSLRRNGAISNDFVTYTLSDVYISSYQTTAEGNVPDEVFSLGFSAIEVSYLPQREDGSLDAPVTAARDVDGTTFLAVTSTESASSGGSVDAFLMIDGIEGESTDVAHHGEIDIGSFSWGELNDGSGVRMHDFTFTALMSMASVELFAAAAEGRPIPQAVLSLRKSGATSDDFFTYTLSDVYISSYQTAAEGNLPDEVFSLGFSAIEVSYLPQREDGTPGMPLTAGWELDGTTLSAVTAIAPASAGGSADAFLMIDGIEGESTDVAHHGEIDIGSFSWGEFNDGSGVRMQDFTFTALTSKASVKLFAAVADGHTIPQAVLSLRRSGDSSGDFFTCTLSDVHIRSYQTAAEGYLPEEVFSLGFSAIEVSYLPQREDGTLGTPVTVAWDLRNNAPLAADDNVTTYEDLPVLLDVLANDRDLDGDPLTATVVSAPVHGTLTLDLSGSARYTPDADFNGSDSFVYEAADGNEGEDQATVFITITAVNDPPSITLGGSLTVNEDAAAQSVTGFATGFDPGGGPDEAFQSIDDFLVSNDNNSLFSIQPDIDNDGRLTFTPAPDASGTATVTVQVRDNGGTADGGVDTSLAQTFTITLLSPEQQLQSLVDDVMGLGLNFGNANALASKLKNALSSIDHGDAGAAVNQIQAFINQMSAFVNSGSLSQAQADELVAAANEAIYSESIRLAAAAVSNAQATHSSSTKSLGGRLLVLGDELEENGLTQWTDAVFAELGQATAS